MLKLGIDVMGGDFSPDSPLKGALLAKEKLGSKASIVLIGDPELINKTLKSYGVAEDTFEIIASTQVIEMHEHPTKAFVQKPQSSIALGLKALAEGKINTFSSAGNTGAAMVAAMMSIKSIPGVIRPCITSILPKEKGGMGLILDVGTNADCKPDVLYQFGILGSLFAQFVYHIENPKVALLNIGEEPEKGNLVSQAAYNIMNDSKGFNFVGNVEGRDLFNSKADVIVCEGFTGNVVLKEAEAFYFLIKKKGLSDEYFDRFNYELYGGTPILGVNGTVMIGHGISSPLAIQNMLLLSLEVEESKLHEKIKEAFN
jgi:glycerol-3-phosphate acyltransferase PlsX